MTPREFMAAWSGYNEQRNDHSKLMRNLLYGSSRFNASATAMSKDQARSISNYKFPWESKEEASNSSAKPVSEEEKEKWRKWFRKRHGKKKVEKDGN